MYKAETAVKKFSTKLNAVMEDLNEEWNNWDSVKVLTATKLAIRAFPCTVRDISPIECLTGRKPKIDSFFESDYDEKSNSESESVHTVSSDELFAGYLILFFTSKILFKYFFTKCEKIKLTDRISNQRQRMNLVCLIIFYLFFFIMFVFFKENQRDDISMNDLQTQSG